MDYDDNYPTCVETYATLRIFSPSISPADVDATLGLKATKSFAKEEAMKSGAHRKFNGWFLTTKGVVMSRDTRRHIDSLLHQLRNSAAGLASLKAAGADIDISCFWASIGQGGPSLHPAQMRELARLDLPIWWDVYFSRPDDERPAEESA
jgi:hypothetical protein